MPKQVCEICNEVFKHICSNTRCKVFYRQFGIYENGFLTLSPKGKEYMKDRNYVWKKKTKKFTPKFLQKLTMKKKTPLQFALYLRLIGCNDWEIKQVSNIRLQTLNFWWRKLARLSRTTVF